MAYKVIKSFQDRITGHIYEPDDVFSSTDDVRIAELTSSKNNANEPLIQEVQDEDDPALPHVGGGYYELSNGERIRGRDEAIKAEKALKK